ncbi:hypothetical protein Aduo_012436 [Ancylostoma duodenale]
MSPTHVENEKIVCVVQGKWLDKLRTDRDFQPVTDSVDQGQDIEVKLPRHDRRLYMRDLRIENDDLRLILEEGSSVLIVPEDKRKQLFDEAHSGSKGGRFNANKMSLWLRKTVFWPGMKSDLRK